MDRLPGAECFEESHDLTLVIDRAAGDDALAVRAVHNRGLEGRAFPQVKRLRRLNVVMAVIEEVGRAWRRPFVIGKENGMAGRLVERRLKPKRAELLL
jgi:hypothetical protein